MAEAGLGVHSRAVRIVDDLDSDVLVTRKLEHGEVPQVGLRDLAHDHVAHVSVEGERTVEIGDAEAEGV